MEIDVFVNYWLIIYIRNFYFVRVVGMYVLDGIMVVYIGNGFIMGVGWFMNSLNCCVDNGFIVLIDYFFIYWWGSDLSVNSSSDY